MVKMQKSFKDGTQLRTGLLNIKGIRKAFEVEVDGLYTLKTLVSGFCGHDPCAGDQNANAVLLKCLYDINETFRKNKAFKIAEAYILNAMKLSQLCDVPWRPCLRTGGKLLPASG